MSSQDLILSSARSVALSPINLGVSAILGPQFASGTSFGADLLARLLFMIFERILRSIEGLAKSYLDKFAETRARLGEEKAKVLDGVKALQDESDKPKVTEAINEHHRAKFGPGGFPPTCPMTNQPIEPPFFVKFFLRRRERWMEWREEMAKAHG